MSNEDTAIYKLSSTKARSHLDCWMQQKSWYISVDYLILMCLIGYVYAWIFISYSVTYITCPADPKKTLGIKLPFLIMVVKNLKKYFTFEVQVIFDIIIVSGVNWLQLCILFDETCIVFSFNQNFVIFHNYLRSHTLILIYGNWHVKALAKQSHK